MGGQDLKIREHVQDAHFKGADALAVQLLAAVGDCVAGQAVRRRHVLLREDLALAFQAL